MTDEQPRCGLYCARATPEGICYPRCYDLSAADLEELPELEQHVRRKLYALTTPSHGDRVTGSRERPLGLPVDALSFLGAVNNPDLPMLMDGDDQVGVPPLMETLTTWVRHIRKERRLDDWTPTTAKAACKDLLTHHDYATRHPWSFGYAGQIRTAAHHARTLCNLYDAPVEVRPMVKCRSCDTLGLYRTPGDKYWACQACGLLLTQPEYDEWVRMLAAYEKQKGKSA